MGVPNVDSLKCQSIIYPFPHRVAPKGLIDYAVKWVWEPQDDEDEYVSLEGKQNLMAGIGIERGGRV